MEEIMKGEKYKVRNMKKKVKEMKEKIEENEKGVEEMKKMIGILGEEVVKEYMGNVKENEEERVRRVMERMKEGNLIYEMDKGWKIEVSVKIEREKREEKVDLNGN